MSTKRDESGRETPGGEPGERGGADARPSRDDVDESSTESFPASDPPAWGPLHPGAPGEHPEPPR